MNSKESRPRVLRIQYYYYHHILYVRHVTPLFPFFRDKRFPFSEQVLLDTVCIRPQDLSSHEPPERLRLIERACERPDVPDHHHYSGRLMLLLLRSTEVGCACSWVCAGAVHPLQARRFAHEKAE
jgi:hypothetical protein